MTAVSSRQLAALKLLLRRLLQAVPLMLGVVVINFVLIHLAPGSFLELMTAENQVSDPATIELLRKTYGLEDPTWLQLLKYIWALLHFDFGFSYRQNMPVLQAITINLPATLLLMVSSIALASPCLSTPGSVRVRRGATRRRDGSLSIRPVRAAHLRNVRAAWGTTKASSGT